MSSAFVEEFEFWVLYHTRKFTARTPRSRYEELSDHIQSTFPCSSGKLLAHSIWMWRHWKFGDVDRAKFPAFGDYLRFRLEGGGTEQSDPFIQPAWRELKKFYAAVLGEPITQKV